MVDGHDMNDFLIQNFFYIGILYFKTFLLEPHMAHITPILKKKFSNLKFISFLIYIFRKSLIDIGP